MFRSTNIPQPNPRKPTRFRVLLVGHAQLTSSSAEKCERFLRSHHQLLLKSPFVRLTVRGIRQGFTRDRVSTQVPNFIKEDIMRYFYKAISVATSTTVCLCVWVDSTSASWSQLAGIYDLEERPPSNIHR